MRDDDFEQLEIEKSTLENKFELLNDGMKVTLEYVDGKIVLNTKTVEIKIQTADAVVKGQTASSSYGFQSDKGLKVLVPPHIKQGDKIIQSENFEYVEKAK